MTLRRHPRTLLVGALATALVAVSAAGSLADDTVPTQQDVASAQSAVTAKARDVASVQAQLAIANDHLRGAAISAAQATEAYNGARWRLQQAQARTTLAEAHQAQAEADLADQQTAITESLVASYQDAPALQALSAIVESDGIQAATEQATTFDNAQSAMDAQYDAFRATSTLAEVAADQADAARAEAAAAQAEAKRARDAAAEAERSAARQAQEIAGQKEQLIAELARLQGISVKLAEQRQAALEAEAAAAAGHQPPGGGDGGGGAGQPAPDPQPSPDPQPTPDPTPSPDPDPEPAPDPDPPAPGSGADAAIAFAKAQLGEPYRWGAAGPDAWDCSGLTMGSWAAGGKALPHYSVAQYQQSTPITAAQLRPGDLVFWGSSSRSSSIYHVALYVGDGQMIHAPRTGRPVSLESMYYWIPPNFFARP